MADESLLRERFDGEELESIAEALRFLQKMGVFDLFIHANKMKIADSLAEVDETALVNRIREVRQQNRVLMALNTLFPPQAK